MMKRSLLKQQYRLSRVKDLRRKQMEKMATVMEVVRCSSTNWMPKVLFHCQPKHASTVDDRAKKRR